MCNRNDHEEDEGNKKRGKPDKPEKIRMSRVSTVVFPKTVLLRKSLELLTRRGTLRGGWVLDTIEGKCY